MKTPENIKKCVGFLGYKMVDGNYKTAGTIFFVGDESIWLAITAKHVIEGIRSLGLDTVHIRLNTLTQDALWFETSIDKWSFPKDGTVDIASLPIGLNDQLDHLFYPIARILTEQIIKENEIDVGDEVFITGLFKHHYWDKNNIPVIRIGNISTFPEGKIQTKDCLMDGYLIEARSIGGLSGSPVFVNLGSTRFVDGKVKHATTGSIHFLIGIIHGHYDSRMTDTDGLIKDSLATEFESINTGIAIVTPATKLLEHISEHKLSLRWNGHS